MGKLAGDCNLLAPQVQRGAWLPPLALSIYILSMASTIDDKTKAIKSRSPASGVELDVQNKFSGMGPRPRAEHLEGPLGSDP